MSRLLEPEEIRRWQDATPTCDWMKTGCRVQDTKTHEADLVALQAERQRIVEEIEYFSDLRNHCHNQPCKFYFECFDFSPFSDKCKWWQSLKSKILSGEFGKEK